MTLRPRRAHAADPPAGSGAGARRAGPRRRAAWSSGCAFPARREKFAELLEEETHRRCARGDVLVLFTDGITEAMNAESDLFGEGRLGRLVAEHGHLSPTSCGSGSSARSGRSSARADQHDDMTMILIKVERAFTSEERVAV